MLSGSGWGGSPGMGIGIGSSGRSGSGRVGSGLVDGVMVVLSARGPTAATADRIGVTGLTLVHCGQYGDVVARDPGELLGIGVEGRLDLGVGAVRPVHLDGALVHQRWVGVAIGNGLIGHGQPVPRSYDTDTHRCAVEAAIRSSTACATRAASTSTHGWFTHAQCRW